MCDPFLPTILLLVVPVAYFAYQSGVFRSVALRWICAVLLFGIAVIKLPVAGLDKTSLDDIKLLIAGGMAVLLTLRARGRDIGGSSLGSVAILAGAAAVSVLVYTNFFALHGQRVSIHYPEFTHYYLGSKYFSELGYSRLYTAMLAAEAEATGAVSVTEARDLLTNRVVPSAELEAKAAEVKRRFTAARWAEFRSDAAFFRGGLGSLYPRFVTDHGFNATPTWALIGGAVANRVPATSRGIRFLAAFDPLIQLGAFAAIGAAFGLETALLAIVYFCVIFGASFDWVGGAYLRYMSFGSLVAASCALKVGRRALAGALVALATALRLFPALFAVGMVCKTLGVCRQWRSESPGYLGFCAAFMIAGGVLFAAPCFWAQGIGPWVEFSRNISTHSESLSSNFVGLTAPVLYALGATGLVGGDLPELLGWRRFVYELQLGVLLPLAALVVWRARERVDDVSAFALGTLLLLVSVNVAAYYYSVLVVVLLARSQAPGKIALLFLVEAAIYYLQLFERHPVVLYGYRGLMILYLVNAVFFEELWGPRPPPEPPMGIAGAPAAVDVQPVGRKS